MNSLFKKILFEKRPFAKLALFSFAVGFLILTAPFFVLKEQMIFSGFPRSSLFITYFFVFVLCGSLRFAKRVFLQVFPSKKQKEKERTLIVGAGDAGEQLLRSISVFSSSPFLPVGFVDDSPAKLGASIHGLKVFGATKDIPK